ncbi:MAG: DUF3820 family protein [Bacteroidota bacterium]
MNVQGPNPQLLIELVTQTMPFGKYKGTLYYRIPVNYLEWMAREGFPKNKTGMLLSTLHEIKLTGLEFLLLEIKKRLDSGAKV